MEHNVLGKSRLLHGILQEYYENNPKHIIEQSYYTIEKNSSSEYHHSRSWTQKKIDIK